MEESRDFTVQDMIEVFSFILEKERSRCLKEGHKFSMSRLKECIAEDLAASVSSSRSAFNSILESRRGR